ncbi:MAG: hypothetical protein IKY84_09555 [Bacteroidaceae bacterium]|nr:hypothetical protein [Bacteroidaceae bacterium]
MKTRHAFALCLMAMIGLASITDSAQAQTEKAVPQKVETPVKVHHSAEWYKTQERLWKAEIDKNPKNEEAWKNYYHAVRYKGWYEDIPDEAAVLTSIIEDMGKAIPETYTLYIMEYYHKGNVNDAPNMKKAIQMRPDNVEMYPDYVSYLMQTGDEELMADILKRWYNSGTYSPSLLNYAYNELSGMKANSIIFVNGDSPTFSKLLVQYGKHLFEDIDVICMSLLWTPNYRKLICERLSIPDFEPMPQISSQEEADKYTNQMMLHIIKHTRRPAVYFSTLMNVPSFKDKLYSEGLVMRYSEKPYDNLAIKRKNIEENYLTDYLRESFLPENYPASANKFNLNYIPCFKSLLDHYKQTGNFFRYNELRSLMVRIVEQIDVPDEEKQKYYEEINR